METAEYEIMFSAEETHWWYRALHQLIFDQLDKQLPDWKNQPILDAGCGTGAILKKLGNPEKHVGLDLSEEALNFCRDRGLKNVVPGDVQELPFEDNSFAAVISSSVLYHRWVPDIPRALCESRRVLRAQGLLFLNLPACKSLGSAHDEAVFTARRFDRDDVERMVTANGFRIKFLSYWTSLVFPAVWIARRGLLRSGRDYGKNEAPSPFLNGVMGGIMKAEMFLLRRTRLPFGVSLFCVAEKIDGSLARG